jgi:hypothetical protein
MAMFRTPIVILSVVVFASAALAEPAGRALSPRREAESAWGLSLRPPEGTRLIRRTADAYLMRIYDDDGKFQILLSVRRATQPLTVAEILQEAEANLRRVHGTAQRLDQRELEVAGRAAGIIYFDSPRTSGDGRMLLGQAFVPLAVDTLAVLEVEAAMEERPLAAATFEAVLDSLEVGVEQIEAQRMTAVRQTAEFQSNL